MPFSRGSGSGGSLNTVGPLPSLAYDAHGNTTRLADQLLAYDGSDNHATATLDDGTVISYLRDVSGSIVQRTQTVGTTTEVTRYTTGGTVSWFYPNFHGDTILQADNAGARVGVRSAFDPFGQSIDSATGDIGTTTADDAIVDTTPGDADYAFVGGHGKLYEHGGSIATIEIVSALREVSTFAPRDLSSAMSPVPFGSRKVVGSGRSRSERL